MKKLSLSLVLVLFTFLTVYSTSALACGTAQKAPAETVDVEDVVS